MDSGVCGEMAGDPVMVPLLIGLGVDSLSMSPSVLPSVKFVVQNMTMPEAKKIAAMALEETDSEKTMARLKSFYDKSMSQLY